MTQRIDYGKASPEGYKGFGNVHTYLHNCSLPTELINLVYLRISQINGCAYCIDKHSRDLVKGGLSVDKLVMVPAWEEAGVLFSARERAAFAWAESLTLVAETGIPDSDFKAASAEFNEKELADLSYAIALMNALNRLGISARKTPAVVANLKK